MHRTYRVRLRTAAPEATFLGARLVGVTYLPETGEVEFDLRTANPHFAAFLDHAMRGPSDAGAPAISLVMSSMATDGVPLPELEAGAGYLETLARID
jgi:hypothetical protein